MSADTNRKIATLTTDAIKTTTDNAAKAILAAVEAAEEKTREMRAAAEEFIKELQTATSTLTGDVTSHVESCQAAIESFERHHLTILNSEPRVAEVESNLSNLRRIAGTIEGGR